MSTIPGTGIAGGAVAAFNAAGGALVRCWAAYMMWRIERLAAARLGAMSDGQLGDRGIVRSQIAFAVKGELGTRWRV